ncbi:MAG: VOC family protein [Haloplanus sp.]
MSGIGRVALRVTDLDRVVAFYERVVGLALLDRTDERAVLGVDDPLLVLLADPDATPRGEREAGLFHTAVRVPSRAALADALDRIEDRWHLDGASDHHVSEALYLTDPENNGVEVYRDRSRSAWPVDDGRVEMDTLPLALDDLRAAGEGGDACPSGTTVGHVHLEPSSLSAARAFYVEGLGLRVRQSMASAHFLAVDDYHHHVGLNTWNGRDQPTDDATRGLAWFELLVDESPDAIRSRLDPSAVTDTETGLDVTDPDGMTVKLRER